MNFALRGRPFYYPSVTRLRAVRLSRRLAYVIVDVLPRAEQPYSRTEELDCEREQFPQNSIFFNTIRPYIDFDWLNCHGIVPQ